jgi:predicted RND superfamily exporter protein
VEAEGRSSRALAQVTRLRGWLLVAYAFLVPGAALLALRIPSEGGIDRLIVPSDPDYQATRAFQRLFPEPQTVLLLLESEDPWSPGSIARLERAQAALRGVPHLGTFSVLEPLRRARPSGQGGASVTELKRLALGTAFFRRQGLVGDHFLTLVVDLGVRGADQRDQVLADLDGRLEKARVGPVRKVGAPYVSAWLEDQSASASRRAFPVFGMLLVGIVFFLYRSWRTLLAMVLALAAAVALSVGAGALLGFTFTIVSVLVPLTILVTTLASLVYVHSRFVDRPEGVPVRAHHLFALRNKLLPVTASTLAAAMGFGALAVSRIRPIREMGVWTAVGLLLSWVVVFTLFPALQLVLRTPTGRRPEAQPGRWERVAEALPAFTYRHRWMFTAGALVVCAAGALAVFGVPGLARGMSVGVDTLAYLDPATPLARDLRWFRAHVMDLNVARVWIHLGGPQATDPEVLLAVDRLESALEALPDVTAVTGPTTPMRMRSYLSGEGEDVGSDPARFARAAGDVEQLLLTQPELRSFIDVNTLSDMQLTLLFRHGDAAGYQAMAARVRGAWDAIRLRSPALRGAELRVVGESLLQAKVGASLVPTLAESFLLTVALIFTVFLFLFRSGLERLLAMIPSLFALLAAFLGMRALGGALNVATIIIATTVVGTTENDQIHFFHHLHERSGGLEERLRHALSVSGKAILFATVINAAGFLGLAFSSFPPLRQFGLMTSAAFLLAMLADFTALPAALWIALRERPGGPTAASATRRSGSPRRRWPPRAPRPSSASRSCRP